MKTLKFGPIQKQVDEILNSADSEWINVLNVTIAVLHTQFIRERCSEGGFEEPSRVSLSGRGPTVKFGRRKAV